jgi:hypothetical protein
MEQRIGTEVRYFLIVSRRDPSLYDYLRRQFEGDEKVLVVLDRRKDDRRQHRQGRAGGRRQRERRRRTPDSLRSIGTVLVRLE